MRSLLILSLILGGCSGKKEPRVAHDEIRYVKIPQRVRVYADGTEKPNPLHLFFGKGNKWTYSFWIKE